MTATADLTALNTLQLAATAQRLVTVTSQEQLRAELVQPATAVPINVLGGGSNVILHETLPGTTVLMNIMGREVLSDDGRHVIVRAGAGENWHEWVLWCHHRGFHGLAMRSAMLSSLRKCCPKCFLARTCPSNLMGQR